VRQFIEGRPSARGEDVAALRASGAVPAVEESQA